MATPSRPPSAPSSGAAVMLAKQFKEMKKARDLPQISCGLVKDNVFEWEIMLMISEDSGIYGGANFRASLSFPPTYPHAPPTMRFLDTVPWHPNVYKDGKVCISILHPPEDDEYGYEKASERWSPVQTPETILLSVISLIHSPNDESPANIDAARMWRDDPKEFKKRCRKCVRQSLGED